MLVCTYNICWYVVTTFAGMYLQHLLVCTYNICWYVLTTFVGMYLQHLLVCTYNICWYVVAREETDPSRGEGGESQERDGGHEKELQ